MILGDLSILADGAAVEVAPATEGAKLAGETGAPDHRPPATGPLRPANDPSGKAENE